MKRKEFPMPDKYNEQAAKLLELLEIRDKINKELEFMTPERRRQVVKDSAEIDKKIQDFETLISVHYEVHQLQCLVETEMAKIDARQFVRIQKMYIYLKHRATQEKLDEFIEIINILPPDERENFYDQAAILEATELDEILDGKKS